MRFKSSISALSEPSTDRILAFGQVKAMLYATLAVSQLLGCKLEGRKANRTDGSPMTQNFPLLTY